VKKKIKHLIGFVSYYTGLLNLINCFRKKALKSSSFTILTYHSISAGNYGDSFLSISPANFEKQIRYLTKRYKVVPLEKLIRYMRFQHPVPDDYIAITFDDGYRDNYLNAYPVLKKYKAPATIFLATGFIGTDKLFWWDRVAGIARIMAQKNPSIKFPEDIYPRKIKDALLKISSGYISSHSKASSLLSVLLKEISEDNKNLILDDLEKQLSPLPEDSRDRPYPLTWDEVKEMSGNGIEFGSHTVTHPILTKIENDRAGHEISHSKEEIEKIIGKKVLHFSYPNGEKSDFNENIKQFIKDNNYISACTTINGTTGPHEDVFSLKRRAIYNTPVHVFATQISGIFDLLKNINKKSR